MTEERWISVRNWRKFQHYDPAKRTPPWIKVYTELMSDDAFLGLTPHQRGILVSTWMEYASARCQLRANTVELSRRLNGRVTKRTLEALNHAGFIDIVASAVLAEGYQCASATLASRVPAHSRELETEKEKEQDLSNRPCGQVETQPDAELVSNSNGQIDHLISQVQDHLIDINF